MLVKLFFSFIFQLLRKLVKGPFRMYGFFLDILNRGSAHIGWIQNPRFLCCRVTIELCFLETLHMAMIANNDFHISAFNMCNLIYSILESRASLIPHHAELA